MNTKKILIVDNDSDLSFIISEMLEGCGYSKALAGSAEEAFNILTNNRFHFILLDINLPDATGFEICGFIEKYCLSFMQIIRDIIYEKPCFTVNVNADRGRTAQMIENLINNARKYAKSDVNISVTRDNSFVYLHFKDSGPGISDEDMPFIFNKFYRGNNCGDESGSGLGLFI